MDYEVIEREHRGGKLTLGDGTMIGRRVSIDTSADVIIGENCWISEDVLILTHGHPTENWYLNKDDLTFSSLSVGNNVFIGARAVITDKVRNIGSNSFIGVGAVVTKDVPPYTIMAGNPAKEIGVTHDGSPY